ncbi:2741_t:CDS:2, partial [Scutellospora calospora]
LFPDSFQNLLNLHISRHIVDNARQYVTYTNTAVGTKEMVHRIFKLIVPHTNKKNLELNLLKQVNTLQTLRYLADRGIDDRWCIDNHNLSIYILQELDQ